MHDTSILQTTSNLIIWFSELQKTILKALYKFMYVVKQKASADAAKADVLTQIWWINKNKIKR